MVPFLPLPALRRPLPLLLAAALLLSASGVQACERHLRGHSGSADAAGQLNQR